MRAALILAAALAMLACLQPESAVPYYGGAELTPLWHGTSHQIKPFRLQDQFAGPCSEADLDGHPTVIRFFFSRCGSLCPTLTQHLRRVEGVSILSISVTPEDDSPEWLRAYAQAEGLPSSWRLLTGDLEAIHRLARESLFCGAEDFRKTLTGREVLHSEKVFLVDGRRQLRGVYNGSLALELDHLNDDLKLLNTPATSWLPGL